MHPFPIAYCPQIFYATHSIYLKSLTILSTIGNSINLNISWTDESLKASVKAFVKSCDSPMVLDKPRDHTIYTVDRTCHPGAARSARGTSMVPIGQQSVMRNMLKESNKIVQYLKNSHSGYECPRPSGTWLCCPHGKFHLELSLSGTMAMKLNINREWIDVIVNLTHAHTLLSG